MAIAVGLPVLAAMWGRPAPEVVAFAACGGLVVLRHRENIARLRRGEERPLQRGAAPDL